MSLRLSDDHVRDLDECVGKDLLAYVYYPEHGMRCFAYPQYLVEDDRVRPIDHSAFPDAGCLPTVVATGSSIETLRQTCGSIVVMRVNSTDIKLNYYYPQKEPHYYNAAINTTWARGRSLVEFDRLSKDRLSSRLVQVVSLRDDVPLDRPLAEPLALDDDAVPQTRQVVVRRHEDGSDKVYGPLECDSTLGGLVALSAPKENNLYIARLELASLASRLVLTDDQGMEVATFLLADELAERLPGASHTYDWVSDQDLRDALGRIAAATTDPGFTRAQVRALKAAVEKCDDETARIALDESRRRRLLGMLENYEDWSALPEEVKEGALSQADPQQLAEYVLSDEHFQAFYDKVIENDQIRGKVEQERAGYDAETKRHKAEAETARKEAQARTRELDDLNRDYERKRRELEAEVERQTTEARTERDALRQECDGLRAQVEDLNRSKTLVEDQIRGVVYDMGNETTVTRKVLESEMLRQVVSAITPRAASGHASDAAGSDAPAAPEQGRAGTPVPTPASPILPSEGSLADADVIDRLYDAIAVRPEREYSRNDVIDLLICLTQGYITTLAGLPGTGKTSLAGLLAGGLGLLNSQERRYCEVSVERGWTSYKDFIGYYNPLTHTMEKSDVAAFDAFALLDAEARAHKSPVAPYLFLLDEANLSSVEHYWSPFLKACDSFSREPTSLSLGASETLLVPAHTRFLATVNFDHTTEELSPRFLDRSWVIMLDPQTVDADDLALSPDALSFEDQEMLSYDKLVSVFGRGRTVPPDDQQAKLRSVVECFTKAEVPISSRSQRMMLDFVAAASLLMDTKAADTAYAPVDYAVAQKVLPLVNGPQDRMGPLVASLLEIGGLPLCARRLQRMQAMGDDSGYYQFFA